MRITVEVLRLDTPALVDVTITPPLWQRIFLRRKVQSFTAAPITPGARLWLREPLGRVLPNEVLDEIHKAIDAARIQRRLDEYAIRVRRAQFHIVN